MPDLPIADDGLPARDSGKWAEEKLYYLRRYIDIFTTGMWRKWNGNLVFLDLMAGPGRCYERETGRCFEGSPLIALRAKTPFKRVLLVEQDPALNAALRQRVAAPGCRPTPEIIADDVNSPTAIQAMRDVANGALALAFVDLLGWEVTFATIRELTDGRNVDLLITFPEMALTRNAGQPQESQWNAFFGTTVWRGIVSDPRPVRHIIGLRQLYQQQLKTIHYTHSALLRRPMKNQKGGAMYRPLFASRSGRGLQFWNEISRRGHDGSLPLFG